MRRIRFTIASLLVVVLFVAVGFAGLREANDLWDSRLFTLTLGVLLVSILLAIHRTEFKRAFWLGFALFGSTYLTLSLVPSIEYRLLTKKALTYLDSKVPGQPLGVFTVPLTGIGSDATSNQVQAVAFSIDGRQLATSSQGRVRLWPKDSLKVWSTKRNGVPHSFPQVSRTMSNITCRNRGQVIVLTEP